MFKYKYYKKCTIKITYNRYNSFLEILKSDSKRDYKKHKLKESLKKYNIKIINIHKDL